MDRDHSFDQNHVHFRIGQSIGDGVFDSVTYAIGRPKIVTVMNMFRIICAATIYRSWSIWGIIGVAWGFATYGVLGRLFGQYLLKRSFNFSFIKYLKEIYLGLAAATVASGVSIHSNKCFLKPGILSENLVYFLAFIAWLAVYGCFILAFASEKCLHYYYLLSLPKTASRDTVS